MNLSNYCQYKSLHFYVIRLIRLYKSIANNRNFIWFKNSNYKYVVNWELYQYYCMWKIEKKMIWQTKYIERVNIEWN